MKQALNCGRVACLNVVTDAEVIEPYTLAMYSAFSGGKKSQEGKDKSPAKVHAALLWNRKID